MSESNPFKKAVNSVSKPSVSQDSINNNINQNPTPAFDKFFGTDDEEYEALAKVKEQEEGQIASFSQHRDRTDLAIEQAIKDIAKKHPGGGIKRQHFINYDILKNAPDNYFDRYVRESIQYASTIREELAKKEQSDLIAAAQSNKKDEQLQNRAFGAVHTIALEQIPNYRGLDRQILLSFITNEILGLSVLEPLWRESSIDEIICNGIDDIQVEIRGQLYKVPSVKFESVEHMESLLSRLYEAVGKVYSQTTPLNKARLHDNSRLFSVHPIVAPDGPNLNIRKHPESYWTPKDIIEKGSASEEMMTELGNLIHKGTSFLVIGGTSTGKELKKDTKIPTPTGMTTIGEIKVGDLIFDHHGSTGTVTNIYPQPLKTVYKITFDTGEYFYAGAEHNWYVSTSQTRKSHIYRKKERKRKKSLPKETLLKIEKTLPELKETITFPELEKLTNYSYSQTVRSTFNKNFKNNEHSKDLAPVYNTKPALEWLIEYGKGYVKDQRHKQPDLYKVLTTKQMLEQGVRKNGRNQFRTPVLEKPVEFIHSKHLQTGLEPQELPIHPYLFGLWLGDGSSYNPQLYATEKDADAYNKLFKDFNLPELIKLKNRYSWKITDPNYRKKLKKLGLMKKQEGGNKFIPEIYKTASIESRKLLLAGLIDTDGSVDRRTGSISFTNTSKPLVDAYINIASSLGYKVHRMGPINKTYTYNNKKKQGKDTWIVSFHTEDLIPLLPRKRSTQKIGNKKEARQPLNTTKTIVNIEELKETDEMVCITVDTPDSTFLVGDGYTTTHNTSMLNALTGFYKDDIRIVTLEDNLEMKPNPNKLLAAAMESKPARPDKPNDTGVTMRDLVKASTQIRPDAIIIGEVTDGAALDLVNALNTGHIGASTLHANSEFDGIYRLSSLMGQTGEVIGDATLPLIAAAFDFIIYLEHFPQDGSRRISSISEVSSRVAKDSEGNYHLPLKQLWSFKAKGMTKAGRIVGDYHKTGEISEETRVRRHLDLTRDLTWPELERLSSI